MPLWPRPLPTTEALIDLLKVDQPLRRLCGFSSRHRIPGKHRFSRAFTEFTDVRLAERSHEFLIQTHLGDQLIGHVARDSTAIEARERPVAKMPSVHDSQVMMPLMLVTSTTLTYLYDLADAAYSSPILRDAGKRFLLRCMRPKGSRSKAGPSASMRV